MALRAPGCKLRPREGNEMIRMDPVDELAILPMVPRRHSGDCMAGLVAALSISRVLSRGRSGRFLWRRVERQRLLLHCRPSRQ